MTEEEFEQEVRFYRQAIVEAVAHTNPDGYLDKEVPMLFARFEALSREDFTRFQRLCVRLLEDEQYEVRLGTIKLLRALRRRDNVLSALLILIAVKQKDLREEALFALRVVGTRAVLPQLLLFANKGYSPALDIVRRMLQTPEEIERGITIARKYIAAKDYELREAALFLLQKYSSMDKDAEYVLDAVQKYKDELFIDALKDAPPEIVLEPLLALRSTSGKQYVQYWDLTRAIEVLEQKKREAEEG